LSAAQSRDFGIGKFPGSLDASLEQNFRAATVITLWNWNFGNDDDERVTDDDQRKWQIHWSHEYGRFAWFA